MFKDGFGIKTILVLLSLNEPFRNLSGVHNLNENNEKCDVPAQAGMEVEVETALSARLASSMSDRQWTKRDLSMYRKTSK